MNPYLPQVRHGKRPASAKLLSTVELDFESAEGGTRTHTPLQEADFKFAKSELLDRFIASKRESLSQRTIDKSYRVDLDHSREVIGFNVTGQQIQQFLNSRRCSNGGKHA